MNFLGQIISTACAVFPAWLVAIFLGFIAFALILIIIKVVAFVKSAIPFL